MVLNMGKKVGIPKRKVQEWILLCKRNECTDRKDLISDSGTKLNLGRGVGRD